MQRPISKQEWALLWLLALAIRLPTIWLVRNAHGDAYSYAEVIATMSAKISEGTFAFKDLFGFWLPLYQFVSAFLASASGLDPMIAAKAVSTLAGAATAIILFDLTCRLTRTRTWAWLAFGFLLFDPSHLFLSALSMTEASHSLLVLAAIRYAALGRWKGAALCGALAGLVRIDSWLLLPLLPALQYVRERRISFVVVLCLLAPPVLWLAISYAARGDVLAYFSERAKYVQAYLEFAPSRRGFGFIGQDLYELVIGAHPVVFPIALIAVASVLWRSVRRGAVEFTELVLAAIFAAMLGFLVLAYLSRSQPIIWDRYGSIFFVLGLPIAARYLQQLAEALRLGPGLRYVSAALLLLVCFAQAADRGKIARAAIMDDHAHQRIATQLRSLAAREGWNTPPRPGEQFPARCFCDDAAVRVLSRLPTDRFLRTYGNEHVASLTEFLEQHGARYVVASAMENSLPLQLLPDLTREGQTPSPFKLLAVERSPGNYGPDIWLFEETNVRSR